MTSLAQLWAAAYRLRIPGLHYPGKVPSNMALERKWAFDNPLKEAFNEDLINL